MGKHYIPREYLRGFTKEGSNQIWAYSKQGKSFLVSLEKIAQETDMYSDETESFLTEEIEGPGNLLLKKLRDKELLNEQEKRVFSEYMYTTLHRTPDSYEDYVEQTPKFIERLRETDNNRIDKLINDNPKESEILNSQKKEINQVLDEFKLSPPKEAWEAALDPKLSQFSVPTLSKMTWVLFYENYNCFLTCDRPFHYFKNLGLGNKYSEFSFPISSRISIWGSWRKDIKDSFRKPNRKVIKNINDRTLSNVYRHALFHGKREWIEKVIKKKDIQVKSIKYLTPKQP